jgi:hypothetical protein
VAAAGDDNGAAASFGLFYPFRYRREGRMGEGLARTLRIDKSTSFQVVDSFGQGLQPEIARIELLEGHYLTSLSFQM